MLPVALFQLWHDHKTIACLTVNCCMAAAKKAAHLLPQGLVAKVLTLPEWRSPDLPMATLPGCLESCHSVCLSLCYRAGSLLFAVLILLISLAFLLQPAHELKLLRSRAGAVQGWRVYRSQRSA